MPTGRAIHRCLSVCRTIIANTDAPANKYYGTTHGHLVPNNKIPLPPLY